MDTTKLILLYIIVGVITAIICDRYLFIHSKSSVLLGLTMYFWPIVVGIVFIGYSIDCLMFLVKQLNKTKWLD